MVGKKGNHSLSLSLSPLLTFTAVLMLARSSAALSANDIDAHTGARSASADSTASTCSGVDGAAGAGALAGSEHGSGEGRRAGVRVAMAWEAKPIGTCRAPPMARQMGVAMERRRRRRKKRRGEEIGKEQKKISTTKKKMALFFCLPLFSSLSFFSWLSKSRCSFAASLRVAGAFFYFSPAPELTFSVLSQAP
jgi:hypothetical protein